MPEYAGLDAGTSGPGPACGGETFVQIAVDVDGVAVLIKNRFAEAGGHADGGRHLQGRGRQCRHGHRRRGGRRGQDQNHRTNTHSQHHQQ